MVRWVKRRGPQNAGDGFDPRLAMEHSRASVIVCQGPAQSTVMTHDNGQDGICDERVKIIFYSVAAMEIVFSWYLTADVGCGRFGGASRGHRGD